MKRRTFFNRLARGLSVVALAPRLVGFSLSRIKTEIPPLDYESWCEAMPASPGRLRNVGFWYQTTWDSDYQTEEYKKFLQTTLANNPKFEEWKP